MLRRPCPRAARRARCKKIHSARLPPSAADDKTLRKDDHNARRFERSAATPTVAVLIRSPRLSRLRLSAGSLKGITDRRRPSALTFSPAAASLAAAAAAATAASAAASAAAASVVSASAAASAATSAAASSKLTRYFTRGAQPASACARLLLLTSQPSPRRGSSVGRSFATGRDDGPSLGRSVAPGRLVNRSRWGGLVGWSRARQMRLCARDRPRACNDGVGRDAGPRKAT